MSTKKSKVQRKTENTMISIQTQADVRVMPRLSNFQKKVLTQRDKQKREVKKQ
jgi:hypothetical protein